MVWTTVFLWTTEGGRGREREGEGGRGRMREGERGGRGEREEKEVVRALARFLLPAPLAHWRPSRALRLLHVLADLALVVLGLPGGDLVRACVRPPDAHLAAGPAQVLVEARHRVHLVVLENVDHARVVGGERVLQLLLSL